MRIQKLSLICGLLMVVAPLQNALAIHDAIDTNTRSVGAAKSIASGAKAPDFSLPLADNKKISLSDFSGKVIYLDFWASWCPPCKHSLPWMNEIQQRFENKKFSVIAINLDQDSKKAKQLIESQQLNYPILFDGQGVVAKLFQLPSMPTSFLIDQNGKVALVHSGFREKDRAELESAIAKLINNEKL